MREFDELVAVDGVLMAGRFGPDGRVAEYKTSRWFIENPVTAEIAHWFLMLGSMAYAIDVVSGTGTGFNPPSWPPMKGWAYTGGDYMIAVRADRFIIAERAKLGSLDELDRLVGQPAAPEPVASQKGFITCGSGIAGLAGGTIAGNSAQRLRWLSKQENGPARKAAG